MNSSTVSERGQVTVPKPIRDALGLRPGVELEFEARDGLLIGRKRTLSSDPVARVTGILPPTDVDAVLRRSRGPAWSKRRDADRG
jgi:AbrB family looped-hinge helix DNA binding protein